MTRNSQARRISRSIEITEAGLTGPRGLTPYEVASGEFKRAWDEVFRYAGAIRLDRVCITVDLFTKED